MPRVKKVTIEDAIQEHARKPASEVVAEFASLLATRANDTAERLDDKLQQVMIDDSDEPIEGTVDDASYPPLFEALNEKLLMIEASLNRIDSIIERTDL